MIELLTTNKPDTEVAKELKAELVEASKVWCEICTKALASGFHVQANFAPNAFNQIVIQQLLLIKQF